jgi:hypothetical protein
MIVRAVLEHLGMNGGLERLVRDRQLLNFLTQQVTGMLTCHAVIVRVGVRRKLSGVRDQANCCPNANVTGREGYSPW